MLPHAHQDTQGCKHVMASTQRWAERCPPVSYWFMVEYLLGQMQHIATITLRSLFCCPVFQLVTDDDCCDISAGQLLAHTSLQCVNVTGESVSTMERGLLFSQATTGESVSTLQKTPLLWPGGLCSNPLHLCEGSMPPGSQILLLTGMNWCVNNCFPCRLFSTTLCT